MKDETKSSTRPRAQRKSAGLKDEAASRPRPRAKPGAEPKPAKATSKGTLKTPASEPAPKQTARTLSKPAVKSLPKRTSKDAGTTQPSRSLLTEDDLYLFNEGSHFRIYEKLGAHPVSFDGATGTYFAVWAPDADYVSVIGDFNEWDRGRHRLQARSASGIWEGFLPGVGPGAVYKFHIASRYHGYRVDKADPYGNLHESPPLTASIVADLDHAWGDADWMKRRAKRNALDAPISVYELHFGSWRRKPEEGERSLTYREMAPELVAYMRQMGFTHVEFMPLMEHPFYGSWGYQITGYFAATSRYGSPQDLMYLIDQLHQNDIGVILDWVPSHFPTDQIGLGYFDGTHLYEHADTRKGFHPDWSSLIFNYGRPEVQSFLIANAMFWLDKFHIDGLRVDAVASMLYLDYSREEDEWIPNAHGGRENLEAIAFLRRFNEEVFKHYPDVQTIAEESTSWPGVSRPTYAGGLGFGLKWDMGWMHDTLQYLRHEPIHRKYHHGELTFRMIYAFSENFMMPLSHDEVVHGKGSLIAKMPGDDWQRFASLRALYGYMWGQPGKKLLFMGCEFGQRDEWNHERSLDWHLTQFEPHAGLQRWVADLNRFYASEPAMHEGDCDARGFAWLDANDAVQSIVTFVRMGLADRRPVVIACNFTPVVRHNYRIGVDSPGRWREVLNSDASWYGGSGQGNLGGLDSAPIPFHGRNHSLNATLPPLGIVFFQQDREPT